MILPDFRLTRLLIYSFVLPLLVEAIFIVLPVYSLPPSQKESDTTNSVSLISDTTILEHFQKGDSNQPSGAWLAFQRLLKAGSDARPQIDQLINSKASGSKLYGAILLLQIDRAKAINLLKSWQNDKSRVLLSNGCSKEETTLGDLSKRLLKGEQLVMLRDPN